MMALTVLCVGKLKERFYLDAAAEYAKRLSAHCKLTVTELPERRLPERPSPAQIEEALRAEGAAVLERIPKGAEAVALCVEGDLLSSEELAAALERRAVEGTSSVCFVIGGSYGLHEEIKARCALRLSLSRMTLPHHLARVVLLEQLYRCFQIGQGSRYHK